MDDTPAMPEPGDITLLLERAHLDEPGALETLCQRCLPEIRGIAHGALRQTVRSPDLHTTVVLHEVFIKLHGGSPPRRYQHRAHYFGSAARAARQVVTDFGRRGITRRRVLDALANTPSLNDDTTVDGPDRRGQRRERVSRLGRAFEELLRSHPRVAQVVVLRMIHELTEEQIALRIGVSRRTVQNDWQFARAFLRDALEQGPDEPDPRVA